jgi:hypothetical protein
LRWPARRVLNAVYALITQWQTEEDVKKLDAELEAPSPKLARAHETRRLAVVMAGGEVG